MRRRRSHAISLSFFSFQDVITTVTGILLLITLVLAASLTLESPADSNSATESMKAHVESLRAEYNALSSATQDKIRGLSALQRIIVDSVAPPSGGDLDVVVSKWSNARRESVLRRKQELAEKVDSVARIQNATELLKRRVVEIQSQIAKAQTDVAAAPTTLSFISGFSDKRPVLIEVEATSLRCGMLDDLGRPQLQLQADVNDLAKLKESLSKFDARREYFVILVRPQGAEHALVIQETIRDAGFDLGWDAAPDELIFQEPSR